MHGCAGEECTSSLDVLFPWLNDNDDTAKLWLFRLGLCVA